MMLFEGYFQNHFLSTFFYGEIRTAKNVMIYETKIFNKTDLYFSC